MLLKLIRRCYMWIGTIILYLQCTVSRHDSLSGRLGVQFKVYTWECLESFLKVTRCPLQSTSSGSVNWLRSGNWVKGHNCPLMWLESGFYPSYLKFFLLNKLHNTLIGCSFISFLGTLWLINHCQRFLQIDTFLLAFCLWSTLL